MSKGKKYAYRVAKNRNNWKVEITRQVTSSRTVVSKRQAGFATEEEAKEWGEKELKSFVENLSEKNKQHGKQRELRNEKKAGEAQAALDAKKAFETKKLKENNEVDDF